MTTSTGSSIGFDDGGGPAACAECGQPITERYYEVGGHSVCQRCQPKIAAALGRPGRTGRAALFGLGGAVLGALLYYAVVAITGYEIGLVAIVVGLLVGAAVHKGAGVGGRRYQILALALTYLSIGATYVPLAMREISNKSPDRTTADSAVVSDSLAEVVVSTPATDTAATVRNPGAPEVALGLGALLVVALALPLLVGFGDLPGSLITLLIIFFALQQAWRMNRGNTLKLTGPFRIGQPGGPAGAGAA